MEHATTSERSSFINDRRLGMIHYRSWGPPGGEPVVFLHGFMGDSEEWRPIAGQLTPGRYCVAVDLPGHGGTVSGEEDTWDMGFASRVIHRVQERLDLARPAVAGYSMGGRLALYLAVFQPERLSRVVIESGSPGLDDLSERRQRRQRDETLAGELEDGDLAGFLERWYAQPVFASLKRRSDLLEAALSHRMHGNPRGWAKSLRDMGVGMQPCLWQHLLRVEAPALLVTGTEDPKFRGIAAKMAAELPHAEEAAIGGAGHNTHLERPTEFVSALRRFLDGDSEQ